MTRILSVFVFEDNFMMLKLQKILKKPNTVRLQGVFEAKKDSVKPKKEK